MGLAVWEIANATTVGVMVALGLVSASMLGPMVAAMPAETSGDTGSLTHTDDTMSYWCVTYGLGYLCATTNSPDPTGNGYCTVVWTDSAGDGNWAGDPFIFKYCSNQGGDSLVVTAPLTEVEVTMDGGSFAMLLTTDDGTREYRFHAPPGGNAWA